MGNCLTTAAGNKHGIRVLDEGSDEGDSNKKRTRRSNKHHPSCSATTASKKTTIGTATPTTTLALTKKRDANSCSIPSEDSKQAPRSKQLLFQTSTFPQTLTLDVTESSTSGPDSVDLSVLFSSSSKLNINNNHEAVMTSPAGSTATQTTTALTLSPHSRSSNNSHYPCNNNNNNNNNTNLNCSCSSNSNSSVKSNQSSISSNTSSNKSMKCPDLKPLRLLGNDDEEREELDEDTFDERFGEEDRLMILESLSSSSLPRTAPKNDRASKRQPQQSFQAKLRDQSSLYTPSNTTRSNGTRFLFNEDHNSCTTLSISSHSYVTSSANSLASSNHQQQRHHPPSRALQNRLEKARFLQMALESTTPTSAAAKLSSTALPTKKPLAAGSHSATTTTSPSSSKADSYSSGSDLASNNQHLLKASTATQLHPPAVSALQQGTTPPNHSPTSPRSKTHYAAAANGGATVETNTTTMPVAATQLLPLPPPPLYRYSSSADAMSATLSLQEPLKNTSPKTDPSALLWAEKELESQVLSAALSRTTATTTPIWTEAPIEEQQQQQQLPFPLLCAIGTHDGVVTVTELLEPHPDKEDEVWTSRKDSTTTTTTNRNLGDELLFRREGRIRSLDFSPDGQYLAIGGDDCTCAVLQLHYETSPSKKSKVLVAMELCVEVQRVDRVYAVQFSPDSKYLAVGGFDGVAAIISTEHFLMADSCSYHSAASSTCPDIITEIPRDGLVFCLDWSHDGHYLAIAGSDKCVAIIDCHSLWQVVMQIRRPATIQTVKWHPTSSRFLAVGSTNIAICDRESSFSVRYEVDLRKLQKSQLQPRQQQLSLASPSVHSHAETISVPSSPSRSGLIRYNGTSLKINAVTWSPAGSYLVVAGSDKRCVMLETRHFSVIHEVARESPVTCLVWGQSQAQLAPQGPDKCWTTTGFLVIGGEDHKVAILKAGSLEAATACTGGSNVSVGTDDISSAASSYFSGKSNWVWQENAFCDTVHEQQLQDNKHVAAATTPSNVLVTALAFSRGSRQRPSTFLAVATDDGRITVHSTLGGWKTVCQLEFKNPITSMVFSNGSRYLALGGEDARIFILVTAPSWSVQIEKVLYAPVTTLAFSKNNERLAVGCFDGVAYFLDPSQGWAIAEEITMKESPVLAVDWSSENLALGRKDGSICVYDTENLQGTTSLADQLSTSSWCSRPSAELQNKCPVRTVCFGVSSRFLVSGGDDGYICVYSAKGGWVLCHQIRAEYSIASVRWSGNGRHLAFVGDNHYLKVIDTIFWAEVTEAGQAIPDPVYNGSTDRTLSTLAFSQDGKMIAYSGNGRGAHVVDSNTWELAFSLQQQVKQQPKENKLQAEANQAEESDDASSLSSPTPPDENSPRQYDNTGNSSKAPYFYMDNNPKSAPQ